MPRDSPPRQLAGDAPREHVLETTTSETTTTNVTTESKATPTKYEPESKREITPRDCQLPNPAETTEVDSKQNLPTTSTTQDSPQSNAEPATSSGSSSSNTTAAMKDSSSPESKAKERTPSTSGSDTVKRTPSPSASLLTDSSFSTSKTTSSSGSSNGSASTITQGSFSRNELVDDLETPVAPAGKRTRRSSRSSRSPPHHQGRGRPNALNFLEPDSPLVTAEAIQRSMEDSTDPWRASGSGNRKSPSTQSSASSGSSSRRSDTFSVGDHETDRSSSPENSVNGDPSGSPSSNIRTQFATDARKPHPTNKKYGTPEMPRGKANLPHIPPKELQPRLGAQYGYAKHLPRAEKLPLSGYQLLASKLSPSHVGPSTIQPVYRRFETMNHRILLHLQDELAEMEEQLHRLDTADTQTRRLQSCILPASRRSDYLAGGELQWHKTDILGKIGFKLEQYNHVLSSFEKTQNMSTPSKAEVEEYRTFLETQKPITELETRFLDFNDDLVAIGRPRSRSSERSAFLSSGAPTPMPRLATEQPLGEFPQKDGHAPSLKEKEVEKTSQSPAPIAARPATEPSIPSLAAGLAIAVLLPILAFPTIPSFFGRAVVICLVAIGFLNPLLQAGTLNTLGIDTKNAIICAAIYGGAMSVVAAVVA